jgi:hypothetical protein
MDTKRLLLPDAMSDGEELFLFGMNGPGVSFQFRNKG